MRDFHPLIRRGIPIELAWLPAAQRILHTDSHHAADEIVEVSVAGSIEPD